MGRNYNLTAAAKAKQDEFYTQFDDIQNELGHDDYWNFFKDKTIFCNCDDPYESEFFKYFALNFNAIGIKKLIATCYAGSPIAGIELPLPGFEDTYSKPRNAKAYKVIINELKDWNGDGREDLEDIKKYILEHNGSWEELEGNGDFRSPECIELLKQSDVVVTNPPFSLFREYVAQLIKYDKKFVILGPQNAITYKDIFPLIKNDKIWLGISIHSGDREMRVPDHYEIRTKSLRVDEQGIRYIRVPGLRWYTNIPLKKFDDTIPLVLNYSPEAYPKYDNYDAIEVSKTVKIPCDYDGVMGVPITFLDYYNPKQFEILGDSRYHDGQDFADDINFINGKQTYRRILIRRR